MIIFTLLLASELTCSTGFNVNILGFETRMGKKKKSRKKKSQKEKSEEELEEQESEEAESKEEKSEEEKLEESEEEGSKEEEKEEEKKKKEKKKGKKEKRWSRRRERRKKMEVVELDSTSSVILTCYDLYYNSVNLLYFQLILHAERISIPLKPSDIIFL